STLLPYTTLFRSEHELGQILSDRGGTGRERKLRVNSAPERRSSTAGLGHPFGWDLGVEFGWAYRSRTLVLEARQQEAQHPKARRNNARGVSRMDPFLEHPHGQGSGGQTAQRRGQP